MPKVIVRVLDTKIEDGQLIATIKCNKKVPKVGELCTLHFGSTRSLAQNSLLWVYYNWLIEHGNLKDHGHFSPQALHENLKAYFLAEKIMHKGQFVAIEEPTTTTLGKTEFSEYMEKVDRFMESFFGVDVSVFWEIHKRDYAL